MRSIEQINADMSRLSQEKERAQKVNQVNGTEEGKIKEAILTLTNFLDQSLQLNNILIHAQAKPKFDKIRADLGGAAHLPNLTPVAQVAQPGVDTTNGPVPQIEIGCVMCHRSVNELVEKGHGPHL